MQIACSNRESIKQVVAENHTGEIQSKTPSSPPPPPPPPEDSQFVNDLKSELDSLGKNRMSRIQKFKSEVAEQCLTSDEELIILQFILSVRGEIQELKIIKKTLSNPGAEQRIHVCLQQKIKINELNLGAIKGGLNARSKKATRIQYNLPIQKTIGAN